MIQDELAIVRRAYARQVMAAAGAADPALEAAFAAVRREDFLGAGPWSILRWGRGYETTPDDDPVHLYADNLVGILTDRRLNNGQPSLHALLLAAAAIKSSDHVVHIGTGTGYYTAIMARLAARVTGIEVDAGLAARAASNLPGVEVVAGDGTQVPFDPADVIYVNAGVTRPADRWLDGLKEGGRLILPLTADGGFGGGDVRRGAVFCIIRSGDDYAARRLSGVAIFPCAGGRDPVSEAAVAAAFERGDGAGVTRLHRRRPDQGWLVGPDWGLS